MKRPKLTTGEAYHVVTRGVGDLPIFKDENDYYRAIFSIFEFNTKKPVEIRHKRRERKQNESNGDRISDTRDLLVEVWAFYFMPNHIHLLLKQVKNNGITEFMRKFGVGYAGYFNRRHNKKGYLFQGRFNAVRIKNDKQLKTAFVYIHTNGAALLESGWKKKGIKNSQKTIQFLENYKWSSYQDYIGKKNFPSVTNRDFLLKFMGGEKECKKAVNNWIKHKEESQSWNEIALE